MDGGAWWAAVHGVAKSRIRLSDFPFTFHLHALEKEMATHSSVLAWRIPGTGEAGGLPSMGSHRVGHNWSDLAAAAAVYSEQECDKCSSQLLSHGKQRELRNTWSEPSPRGTQWNGVYLNVLAHRVSNPTVICFVSHWSFVIIDAD